MAGARTARRPARHDLLQRQRLVDVLCDATAHPLTVVSAPAGYGKAIAVQQFLDATSYPAVWPALRQADTPAEVWHRVHDELVGAFQRSNPLRAAPQALSAPVADDVLLDTVLNLAARVPEPTILVLHGLESVPADEDAGLHLLWEQLAYFVDGQPPPLRTVVVSRRSAPLPLGRWRTHGRVAEVGREELRFQPTESRELLARLGHAELDGHHVLALTDRAEGWAAGLQLLARSLRHRMADHTAIVAEPVDPSEGRSLLRDILSGHPSEVQDFLVTTSVLDRFTADVCRAVTGSDEAGQLLRAVEEANLFLVPLDENREWFRYQRLFAELLRYELETRDSGAVDQLHQRAATWFKERRDVPQALAHLSRAGRTGQALSLANEDAYRSWWEGSFLGTDWSELFPAGWIQDDPERMIDFAMLLGRSGQMEHTKDWLDRAEKDLQDLPADHPAHLSLLAGKALWHAVYMHAERAIELSQKALEMLEAIQSNQAPSRLFRDRLLAAVLNCYWLLDDLNGVQAVCDRLDRQGEPDVESAGIMRDIVVPATRARLALRQGYLHEAYEIGQSVLHTTDTMGLHHHPARRDAELAVGGVAAEWGDLEQAETLISTIVHERDKVGWVAIGAATRIELARARHLCKGPSSSLAVIGEARAVVRGHPVGRELIAALDAFEARLRIDLGDLPAASRLLEGLPRGERRTRLQVRLAAARGRAERAAELLRVVPPATPREKVVTNLLAARVADALGRQNEHDQHLRNAIALGTEEGFRRTFAVEAPQLARLTHRFDMGPLASSGAHEQDPVTDRELSVLRYLPSRLTNREIATQMEVSDNTLKTHLRSLYRKLGVSSRSDAVIEARRTGLL